MSNTSEITLRALEPEDIDLLYQWENDMKLWEVSNTLTPFSKHQLKKHIELTQLDIYQTKQLRLIIDLERKNKPNTPIGIIDLFDFDPFHSRAGLGIIIHEQYREKGFAEEAIKMLLDYTFSTLGIYQVYANISETNTASLHLFEKCGFILSGRKRKWRKTKNGYIDELLYQKISSD